MGQEVRSHREEMTPTGFVKNGMNRAQSLRFPSSFEGPVAQTRKAGLITQPDANFRAGDIRMTHVLIAKRASCLSQGNITLTV